MSEYQVLSRKYRPKKLDDVIGQGFSVRAISNAFSSNKLAHAFIFTGIRGVGKTTIARIIAMGLNCKKEGKPTSNPCGTCLNCNQILEDRYEDVLEIDAASHTGVDDMREIISSLKYMPSKGSYKVYIIDEVHMLSNSAFNALLKTIEEPPSFVKFIFCTTELQKIPITIVSRCQKYDLNRVSLEEISKFLIKVTNSEGIKITKEAINILSRLSEGSIRDSLTILDQCILSSEGKEVGVEQVNKTTGITGQNHLLNLFEYIIEGKIESAIELLKDIYNKGSEPKQIIEDMLRLNYNLILFIVSKKTDHILNEYNKDKIDSILSKCNLPFLNQIWQMLIKGKEEISKVSHAIEALEVLVIRIAYSCQLPSLEEVVNKIKSDEKSNEFKKNGDNNEIGDDIKKILEIFPDGKVIKNNT
jgi:DNA polymerase-3 subunit gamma/tau